MEGAAVEAFAVNDKACASFARSSSTVVEGAIANGKAGSEVRGPICLDSPRSSSGPKVELMRIARTLPSSVRKKRLSIANDAIVRENALCRFRWVLTGLNNFALGRDSSAVTGAFNLADLGQDRVLHLDGCVTDLTCVWEVRKMIVVCCEVSRLVGVTRVGKKRIFVDHVLITWC